MSAITRLTGTLVSSNVGTGATATTVTANPSRNFLQIQNTHASQNLAFTLEGSTPVVNGTGITLGPLGVATYDTFVPTGLVTVIGSGAATTYSIYWA